MSGPRLEDDTAAGLDEECGDCGERSGHCTCSSSSFDTLEELFGDA